MRTIDDLTGKKIGLLTVIRFAGYKEYSNYRKVLWFCECACGNTKSIPASSLKNGTLSCGCKKKKRAHAWGLLKHKQAIFTPEEAAIRLRWLHDYRECPWDCYLKLCKENCFYCGGTPKNSVKTRVGSIVRIQGLDRLDNSQDHSDPKNLVPCCITCNRAKSNSSFIDYIQWIVKTHRYLQDSGIISK